MFAVCDGHGKHGHKASVLVARHLQETDMANKDVKWKMGAALQSAEKRLMEEEEMELSGTTCVAVVIQPSAITCANVGDSRAVLGRRVGPGPYGGITCTPLSVDHTPEVASEKYRITAKYGEDAVSRATDEHGRGVGPLRVWLPARGECHGLGLAMTRSLGDIRGKEVGVLAAPEFKTVPHESGDSILILASDGLWDMISSEESIHAHCTSTGSCYTP
jgi:serine/threonine protein phosphatase PrpC